MKAILLYSGGLDSTVLLYDLLDQGYEVIALCFDYGQANIKEGVKARKLCEELKKRDWPVKFRPLRIPEIRKDGITFHNRNMILLSIAASEALAEGIREIFIAVNFIDLNEFPDCSGEFIDRVQGSLNIVSDFKLLIIAPYKTMRKFEIVARGKTLGVPFEKTWSCYKGDKKSCGSCLACIEREKALKCA